MLLLSFVVRKIFSICATLLFELLRFSLCALNFGFMI